MHVQLQLACFLGSLASLARAECDVSDFMQCRRNLIAQIFNASALPTKAAPDFTFNESESHPMRGWPAPGGGAAAAGSAAGDTIAWRNGRQRLVWTLAGVATNLTLNATVFHTFNTSGDAPANYPPPPAAPGCPSAAASPDYASYARRGGTLVLYHNGHETATCTPNYDGVVDHLNQLGYDVMELMMPLLGCNDAPQYGSPKKHAWFRQWEERGEATMRFFVEPVVLAVNYAVALGYEHIVLLGLSGGGWTTTLAAAVDARIELSIPTAGSVPKFSTSYLPAWTPDLPEGRGEGEGGGGDYEQLYEGRRKDMYDACDFACMYVLAALEPHRHQLQLLHEKDSCCFAAQGLHGPIRAYNDFVQRQLAAQGAGGGGWMQTAVTAGNYHQVNYRDKVLVATVVERLRLQGGLSKADFSQLPFDLLQIQSTGTGEFARAK